MKQKKKFNKKFPISLAVIEQALAHKNPNSNLAQLFQSFETAIRLEKELLISHIRCLDLWLKKEKSNIERSEKSKDIETIKNAFDSVKTIDRDYIKIFAVDENKLPDEQVSIFNGLINEWDEVLDQFSFNQLYNQVRNYLTKKPYSLNKKRLVFDNPTFLDGWAVNKQEANYGFWLLKDNRYYLAILNPKHKKIVDNLVDSETGFVKIDYHQIAGVGKDIKTLVQLDGKVVRKTKNLDVLNKESMTEELYEIHSTGDYKKQSKGFHPNKLNQYIEHYKSIAMGYENWKKYELKFENKQYDNFKEFTDDIDFQGYKIDKRKVSARYICDLVNDGKLFLFQVYSKDFSEYSKGTPNLHTLYFKALFDDENLKQSPAIFKLNGAAQMFWRKASLKASQTFTHKKGVTLNPKTSSGQIKQAKWDIVKDKRFTQNKYFSHLSTTINPDCSDKGYQINKLVHSEITKDCFDKKINLIGIDRGESNLLYYSLINQKGEIIKQDSLNTIKNNKNPIGYNYQQALKNKAENRQESRKNWQEIENIKELKTGYLSQAVHKIAELAVKHNALIVMENLNSGFKQSRVNIEHQIYQKFEQMLINKLQYLVDKQKDPAEMGGLYAGYQLTKPLESFKKLGRQSGIIFYVEPSYTSITDPVSGFFKCLILKNEKKSIINQLNQVNAKLNYDLSSDCFNLSFNQFVFKKSEQAKNNKPAFEKSWVLSSKNNKGQDLIYYRFNPKTRNNEVINLTEKIKEVMEQNQIDFQNSNNLLQLDGSEKLGFYQSIRFIINLWQQLRNKRYDDSLDENQKDWIQSPVSPFFDSRNNNETLPIDSDANGAYNIARKGLILIDRIKKNPDKPNLMISKLDWVEYINQ